MDEHVQGHTRRIRFTLRTALVVMAWIALLTAFFRDSLRERFVDRVDEQPSMELIDNEREIREMIAAERCVVLAHVQWSTYSAEARETMTEFAREWRDRGDSPPVAFYVIDLTDGQQKMPQYVADWLHSDPRLKPLTSQGMGEVVWMQKGEVLDVGQVYRETADALIRKTRLVFSK